MGKCNCNGIERVIEIKFYSRGDAKYENWFVTQIKIERANKVF